MPIILLIYLRKIVTNFMAGIWSVNSWSFNFLGRPGYLVLPWLEGILISTCLMVPLNILSQSWLHPLLQTHVTNVRKDF